MIKFSTKKLFLTTLLPLFLLVQNSNTVVTSALSSPSNAISVSHLPYVTKLSLGDPLYLDGLLITNEASEAVTNYTFSGYDNANLGTQLVTLTAGSSSTSFEVFVTNELVRNVNPQSTELLISEFAYLDQENIGIELFNPTSSPIDLDPYTLTINYESKEASIISLSSLEIDNKETFMVSHLSSSGDLNDLSSMLVEIDLNAATNITLTKEETIVDKIELVSTTPWFNDVSSSLFGNVVRRHYKTYRPSSSFFTNEWIFVGNDTSGYGLHQLSDVITSVEEQAKAFARYVMFGAGMFAAGRVEEAFFALKSEYEMMTFDAKEFFINNKKVKVEGLNESGKLISATFSEAHARISVLASRSGNPSFIPRDNSLSINFGETDSLLILGVVILFATAGFIFIRFKSKKN